MDEKKYIKVSLGTVICIFIIFLLLTVIFGMYFYYNNKNGVEKNVVSTKQENNINIDKIASNESAKKRSIKIDDSK